MNLLSAKREGYESDFLATTGIDAAPRRQSCRAARWESSRNLKPIFASFEAKSTAWLSHSIGDAPTNPSPPPDLVPKRFLPSTAALTLSWVIIHISSRSWKSTVVAQFFTASETSPLVPVTVKRKA